MSIAIFIFSDGEHPLTRARVERRMTALGWRLAFLRETKTGERLAVSEKLGRCEIIVGWRANARLTRRLRSLLASKAMDKFDALCGDDQTGGVVFYGASPPEDRDELAQEAEMSAPSRRRLRNAVSEVSLETNIGRNRLSSELQWDLAKALGQVLAGVLFFPEIGQCCLPEELGEEIEIEPWGEESIADQASADKRQERR